MSNEVQVNNYETNLRDQFAMAAMQAMLTGQSWNVYELSQHAYKVADVMMEERNKDGV